MYNEDSANRWKLVVDGTAVLKAHKTDIAIAVPLDFIGTMGNSSKDPTTDAPADWVQIDIGGTTYYLPAYAA